jgi:hypothetical protein
MSNSLDINYAALAAAILSPVKKDEKGNPIEISRKRYSLGANTKREKNEYLLNMGGGKWETVSTYDNIEYLYEITGADDAFRALGVPFPSKKKEQVRRKRHQNKPECE